MQSVSIRRGRPAPKSARPARPGAAPRRTRARAGPGPGSTASRGRFRPRLLRRGRHFLADVRGPGTALGGAGGGEAGRKATNKQPASARLGPARPSLARQRRADRGRPPSPFPRRTPRRRRPPLRRSRGAEKMAAAA